jgi:hypothetical protein
MEKKQTAVEWYIVQRDKLEYNYHYDFEGIGIRKYSEMKKEIQEQDKQMEKEEILDAWTDGYSCGMYQEGLGIDYYNETYLGIIKEQE